MNLGARSRAEVLLAKALLVALEGRDIGEMIAPDPGSDICTCLERFIPEVLSKNNPRWVWESLDGLFVAHGFKVNKRRIQLLGTAILTSDQRDTPFLLEIEPSEGGDAIAGYTIKLGEPGEGPLHISGPPCNSGAARRLRQLLPGREALGQVDWVYIAHANHAG